MRTMTAAEITELHAARTAKGDGFAPSLAECLDAARDGRLYDVDTQSAGYDGLEIGDDADDVLASGASACDVEVSRGWSAERIGLDTLEHYRDGDAACRAGAPRRAPSGLSDDDQSEWLRGWDEYDLEPRLPIDIETLAKRRAAWHVARVRSGVSAYLTDEIERCEHTHPCPARCVWSHAVAMMGGVP